MNPQHCHVPANNTTSRAIQHSASPNGIQQPAVDPLQNLEQPEETKEYELVQTGRVIQRKYVWKGQENDHTGTPQEVWKNKSGERFKLSNVDNSNPNQVIAKFESLDNLGQSDNYAIPAEVNGLPYNSFRPDSIEYADPRQPAVPAVIIKDLTNFSALSVLKDIPDANWNSHFHKTDNLARVSLLPVDQTGTSNLFKSDQLWVQEVKISGDRARTKFGKEGQRSHTVAWTLLRAAIEHMHNQPLNVFAEMVEHFFNKSMLPNDATAQTAAQAVAEKVNSGITAIKTVGRAAEISYWQTQISDLLTQMVRYNQLSEAASYADGLASGHGESGHMFSLREADKKLEAGSNLSADELEEVKTAAIHMFDAKKSLPPQVLAEVLHHWVNDLHLAFPSLMRTHHADMVNSFVAKLHLDAAAVNNIKTSFNTSYGTNPDAVPASITGKEIAPVFTNATQPLNLSLNANQSTFVANVAVAPVARGVQADMQINQRGAAAKTVRMDMLPVASITIVRLLVADDRPATRFGLQRSHTVAWTLIRNHLMNFSGKPVMDLLKFITDEMAVLKGDIERQDQNPNIRFDATAAAVKLEADLHVTAGSSYPLHEWQAGLSQLVESYITLYQLSKSAAYAKNSSPGQGESKAMKKLGVADAYIRNYPANAVNYMNTNMRELSSRAVKLMDVVVANSTLMPENWNIAITHGLKLLSEYFPALMAYRPFEDAIKAALSVVQVDEAVLGTYGKPAAMSPRDQLFINLYENLKQEIKSVPDVLKAEIRQGVKPVLDSFSPPDANDWAQMVNSYLTVDAKGKKRLAEGFTGVSRSTRGKIASIPDEAAFQALLKILTDFITKEGMNKDSLASSTMKSLRGRLNGPNQAYWDTKGVDIKTDIIKVIDNVLNLSLMGNGKNYMRWFQAIAELGPHDAMSYDNINNAITTVKTKPPIV